MTAMDGNPVLVPAALTPASPSAGIPRIGWEEFESPELTRRVVVDVGKIKPPVESKNKATEPEDPPNAEQERISSMFQAKRSSTSSSDTPSRPLTSRPSTSSRRSRPMTAVPRVSTEPETHAPGAILTAIFAIENISYDVHLYEDRITWTPVSAGNTKKPSSRNDMSLVERGFVHLHEICAVRLKNIKNIKAETITTIGFAIFTAQSKGGKLREQSTVFLCFSRDICIQWATKIKTFITARSERPKHLLVLSPQSFTAQDVWDDVIEPRLQTVGIRGKFTEIRKTSSVMEYLRKLLSEDTIAQGAESFDGILVVGKTSFFTDVLHVILEYKKQVLKSGTWHPNIPTLGYIPTNSTNYIGKEMHGCTDVETAIFHSIYGCTRSVPICAFYDKDGNFIRYGLTASYGFSGGDTMGGTTGKGLKPIQSTLRKGIAITKAIVQRRSYPCEIYHKDTPVDYEPYNDDEIFAETEFSKFSIVNHHYADDNSTDSFNATPKSDADSGVWPHCDKWDTVPRRNYLDIMVTSLAQHDRDSEFGTPLSVILVRETMSRKELFMGKGSQVSLSSKSIKSKPEILDKTDLIRGSEFIIRPCGQDGVTTASSCWTIDDVCVDPSIQELHVKVDEYPITMYCRGLNQPLSSPSNINVLNLVSDDNTVNLDSMA